MKYTWATDTHFDHSSSEALDAFVEEVNRLESDGLLLSGDIANANNLERKLRTLSEGIDCPIYFVLGNHDYYGSSVLEVRARMAQLCGEIDSLHYLTQEGLTEINPDTALIGHDGWADARSGDYRTSSIQLNDYYHIQDLVGLDIEERVQVQRRLADESAKILKKRLIQAFDTYYEVVLVTHLPPFREACLYNNKISDDNWAPHFVCEVIGSMLLELLPKYPGNGCQVLCGHSHHPAQLIPLPNLEVHVGFAKYGRPWPQEYMIYPPKRPG